MTTYRYKGQTKDGTAVSGVIRAYDEFEAASRLRETVAIITRLEEVREKKESIFNRPIGLKIKEKELALICSQFAIILSAGMSIQHCVEMVAAQTRNRHIRQMLEKVAEEVGAGYSMAQSFENNAPYEFRDYLTEEKNKYFFDYSMREVLRDESGQPTEMNLLACATLKSTVESYRTMLRRAGFRLRVLTPSECAYSAVLQAYYRRTQQEGHDLCVVNLGHSATFLYIYRGGHFASRREIEVGMSDLEHLVADQCSVDIHVAHEYVRQNYNHVLESEQARELYGRIAVEVVKAVNFFNYNNRERELTQLCLCGGGSAIQPLYDTIADTTGMTLHTSAELLGQRMSTEEPWMYLRAIGGVDLGIKGGLR